MRFIGLVLVIAVTGSLYYWWSHQEAELARERAEYELTAE
jgi:hypothetical protein